MKIEGPASKLKIYLDIKEDLFFECSQQVLDLAKNFETRYCSLTNLSKFHSFSLDETAIGESKAKEENAKLVIEKKL